MKKLLLALCIAVPTLASCQTDTKMDEKESKPAAVPEIPEGAEVVTLGAGCFWCIEAAYDQLDGVHSAVSGYMGGTTKNPTYEDICTGTTGHAVLAQNAVDGGSRRYIVVQIPETLDHSVKSHALAAEFCDKLRVPRNLVEVTKERLRRAAKDVQKNASVGADLGFRVFRIGTGECSGGRSGGLVR